MLAMLAGCADGQSVILLAVDGSPAVTGVDHLVVKVSNGGQVSDPIPVPVAAPGMIPPAVSAALVLDATRRGRVHVTVDAADAQGHALVSGAADGDLQPGDTLPLRIVLVGGGGGDMGGGDGSDLGPADLGGGDLLPDGGSDDGAADDGASDDAATDDAAPDDAAPDDAAADDAAPDGATSDGAADDGAVDGGAASDGAGDAAKSDQAGFDLGLPDLLGLDLVV